MGEEPMFEGIDEGDEEVLEGDTSPTLAVRRICVSLHENGDEQLHNNIF